MLRAYFIRGCPLNSTASRTGPLKEAPRHTVGIQVWPAPQDLDRLFLFVRRRGAPPTRNAVVRRPRRTRRARNSVDSLKSIILVFLQSFTMSTDPKYDDVSCRVHVMVRDPFVPIRSHILARKKPDRSSRIVSSSFHRSHMLLFLFVAQKRLQEDSGRRRRP